MSDKSHVCEICNAVHSSALASPDFQGREGENLGQHLAHRLAQVYQNRCIDFSKLSIVSGTHCWVLYVDALVSNSVHVHSVYCLVVLGYRVEWRSPRLPINCSKTRLVNHQVQYCIHHQPELTVIFCQDTKTECHWGRRGGRNRSV